MKTTYLVKAQLEDHEEFLCAIFSESELADTYISRSIEKDINNKAVYKIEQWTMDYYV